MHPSKHRAGGDEVGDCCINNIYRKEISMCPLLIGLQLDPLFPDSSRNIGTERWNNLL